MYKSTRRLTVLTAAVLPIVTLTTAALAANDKTYVGAACRSVENNTAGARAEDGALLNQSQREQTWICPVVKDEMESDPSFGRMTVVENGTNDVKCELIARGPEGTPEMTSGFGLKKSQKIVQTSPLQLVTVYTWGDGDVDAIDNTNSHGYLFFRCVIPARTDLGQLSGVITYKVSEND
jgi:hypothetical protein